MIGVRVKNTQRMMHWKKDLLLSSTPKRKICLKAAILQKHPLFCTALLESRQKTFQSTKMA